ncbi:hypothetical protein [Alkaliphilus serpentinus]|uniref:hypothetical protein n=1 Tax=Alkaliphilus serpentinus TaxID=1482731 RepID=UPI001865876B|nr:hypothetical protein [Alkaliphilus serpentinus]
MEISFIVLIGVAIFGLVFYRKNKEKASRLIALAVLFVYLWMIFSAALAGAGGPVYY